MTFQYRSWGGHIYIYSLIPYLEPVSLGIWPGVWSAWAKGFRDWGLALGFQRLVWIGAWAVFQNKYADRQGFLSEIQRHSARTWSLDVGVYLQAG